MGQRNRSNARQLSRYVESSARSTFKATADTETCRRSGIAPYLVSPLAAAQAQFSTVVYSSGTAINTTNTTGFAAALSAASGADVIIYAGGIDVSIESEGHDRSTIEWPGNQLDLIAQLSQLGKPLVVIQFGGGQVDDSALLSNSNVSAIVWGGYP